MKVKRVRITIGMHNVPREINVEIDDDPKGADAGADALAEQLAEALDSDKGVLALVDTKGNRVLVPGRSIAYVHVGTDEQRFIGFSA